MSITTTDPSLINSTSTEPITLPTEEFFSKFRVNLSRSLEIMLDMIADSYGDDEAVLKFLIEKESMYAPFTENYWLQVLEFALTRRKIGGKPCEYDPNLPVIYYVLKNKNWKDFPVQFLFQIFLEHITNKEHDTDGCPCEP